MDQHFKEEQKFLKVFNMKLINYQKVNEKFIEENFNDEKKLQSFMDIIERVDRSKILNPQELVFYDSYHEVKKMLDDYVLFEDNFTKEFDEKTKVLTMPIWIERHPVLKKEFTERWNKIVIPSFSLSESVFVPRTDKSMAPLFDDKITKSLEDQLDTSKQISYDKEGIAKKLKDYDINNKNEDRVKKAMLMGEILNKISEEVADSSELNEFKTKILETKYMYEIDDDVLLNDGKIFVEEIPYILFLNNNQPRVYNVDFFAEYFKMDRSDFRMIFEFISYPLKNTKETETEKILRFIDLK